MSWKNGEILSVPPFTLLRLASRNPWAACEPWGTAQAARRAARARPAHERAYHRDYGPSCRDFSNASGAVQLRSQPHLFNKSGRSRTRRAVAKMPPFHKAILLSQQGQRAFIEFEGRAVKSVRTAWRKARTRANLDKDVTLYSWRPRWAAGCAREAFSTGRSGPAWARQGTPA